MVSYAEAQVYLFTEISEILLRFPAIVMVFDCPKDMSSFLLPSVVGYSSVAAPLVLFVPLAYEFLLIRI